MYFVKYTVVSYRRVYQLEIVLGSTVAEILAPLMNLKNIIVTG